MNNWYVYIHIFPNGKKYIGITCQNPINRWRKDGSGYKEQPLMWKAIKKYGWNNIEHKILLEGLSKEEAEQKETELIKEFDTLVENKKGYNVQNGGTFKHIINREEVIKLWKTGENMKYIAEKLKCSPKTISYILDQNGITKEEKKQRQQQASAEATQKSMGKKVNQFDLNKNYIATYPSLQEASKAVNANNQYYIKSCCEGKVSKAHGFLWQYYKEENIINGIPKWDNSIKMKKSQKRKVIQYDLNMNELARYDSISEAAKALGKKKFSGISEVCSGKQKTAGGFIWRYEEDKKDT